MTVTMTEMYASVMNVCHSIQNQMMTVGVIEKNDGVMTVNDAALWSTGES